MNQFLENLIANILPEQIEESIQELMKDDEVTKNLKASRMEYSIQFNSLNLLQPDKEVIENYIAIIQESQSHYADLAYLAGFKDAIRLFVGLNLITDR